MTGRDSPPRDAPRLVPRGARRAAGALAAGIALGAALLLAVARPVRVHGASMEPRLAAGDVVLAIVLPGHRRMIRPGDIVVATVDGPLGRPSRVVKRVRTLTRRAGGSGWVELAGENPEVSRDSRAYGTVPLSRVRGLVLCRLYPPPLRGLRGAEGPAGDDASSATRSGDALPAGR